MKKGILTYTFLVTACLLLSTLGLHADDNTALMVEGENLLKSLAYNADHTKVKINDWKIENADTRTINWDQGAVNFNDRGLFEREGEILIGNHGKITHHTVGNEVGNEKWHLHIEGDKEKIVKAVITTSSSAQEKPAIEISLNYIKDTFLFQNTPVKTISYSIKFPNKSLFWVTQCSGLEDNLFMTAYVISYDLKPNVLFDNNDEIPGIIQNELKKFEENSSTGFTFPNAPDGINLNHELVGLFDFSYYGRMYTLGITSTNYKGNDCHCCSPRISFFLFAVNNFKWRLQLSDIDSFSMGSWGSPPSKDQFKIIEIGKGLSAVSLDTGSGGQGFYEDRKLIFFCILGEFQKIFSETIGENGFGGLVDTDWESTFVFKKNDGFLYDIVVSSKGIIDSHFFKKETTYKFDGTKYYPSMVLDKTDHDISNILTYHNIECFIEMLLKSGCFRNEEDVSLYYSDKVTHFFNSTNPTHKSIYDNNVEYCKRWSEISKSLAPNSLKITDQYTKNGKSYTDIEIEVRFRVASSSKERTGESTQHLTLVVERGEIKVAMIAQSTKSKIQSKKADKGL